MKNIIQISLLASVSLFLFACDSSSTTSKSGTNSNTTYNVSVIVSGLGNNILFIKNTLNTSEKEIKSDGQVIVLSSLLAKSSYGISIKANPIGKNCIMGNKATNNSIESNVSVNLVCSTVSVGNSFSGMAYYKSECSVCHKAGKDDMTGALGARADLARNRQVAGGLNYITKDMHTLGPNNANPNLMGRFDNLTDQSVADLNTYLNQVALP